MGEGGQMKSIWPNGERYQNTPNVTYYWNGSLRYCSDLS